MGQAQAKQYNDSVPASGYRILRVAPRSPGEDIVVFPDADMARAGQRAPVKSAFVPWFDIIVSVDGVLMDEEAFKAGTFMQEIAANKDKPVIMEVYNLKKDCYRTVQVTPRDDWGGEGLLGIQIKWEEFFPDSIGTALHVLEVVEGSPAALAGIQPDVDFITGSVSGPFKDPDAFGSHVSSHQGRDVSLYVYNADRDDVRVAHLVIPTHPWGVNNSETGVGLTLAFGEAHALPNRGTLGNNYGQTPIITSSSAPSATSDRGAGVAEDVVARSFGNAKE